MMEMENAERPHNDLERVTHKCKRQSRSLFCCARKLHVQFAVRQIGRHCLQQDDVNMQTQCTQLASCNDGQLLSSLKTLVIVIFIIIMS
mmetsp:Transcript_39524/g.63395  ORF Transcript_39524/g.63395 Transcript_39524/m.63395 type:complete len:89 (-) Transcript_39524:153-419(-)